MYNETMEQYITRLMMEEGCTVNKKAVRKLCNYLIDREGEIIKEIEDRLLDMSKVVESNRPHLSEPKEIDD